MSEKVKGASRMISEAIIESGRFLKLSDKAKTLYMYLMVRTDDEGAVEAYPAMMLIGAGEDELEELISKGFVIRLNDDDVVYVTVWNVIAEPDVLVPIVSVYVADVVPIPNEVITLPVA